MEMKDIDTFYPIYCKVESICEERGVEKLLAHDGGFGKYTSVDSFALNESGADIIVIDYGYDLRRTDEVHLTFEEICMSDEEWNKSIKAVIELRETKEKEQIALRENRKKEQRRKDFKKLKVEFEG